MKTILCTVLIALSLSACNDQKPTPPPEDLNKNMTMPSRDPRAGYTGTPNKY